MMALWVLSASSCADAKVRQYKIKVVKEYPHDEMSYTQGLFFQGDKMIETTGQWGESTLRLVDLATGKALKKFDFDKKYFLEGSVQLGDNIYILTWKNKVAFIYDAKTLDYKQTYSYAREGWGLTTDGKSLIASDGTSRLYWLDEQFKQVNEKYYKYRRWGMLNRPEVLLLKEKTYWDYREFLRNKGVVLNQIKPVTVINSKERRDFFFSHVITENSSAVESWKNTEEIE